MTQTLPAVEASEPGRTLEDPQPRTLGVFDHFALWGNLGVSLLGPVGALGVLIPAGFPALSYAGALLAVVVGTVLGTALIAVATVPGAETGAPAMVLLRGLFGVRASYHPTGLGPMALAVVHAMKVYGLVLADNGSPWYFQGEQNAKWPDSFIEQLKGIPARDFVAVDTSSLKVKNNSAETR